MGSGVPVTHSYASGCFGTSPLKALTQKTGFDIVTANIEVSIGNIPPFTDGPLFSRCEFLYDRNELFFM